MWQVIGRLVRGGCAAQVFFCDAKYAPHAANLEPGDRESTSLIIGMLGILRPYFDFSSELTPRKKDLVRVLRIASPEIRFTPRDAQRGVAATSRNEKRGLS